MCRIVSYCRSVCGTEQFMYHAMEVAHVKRYTTKKCAPVVVCLALLIVLSLGAAQLEANSSPKAINGVLDLVNWDWDGDGFIALDGQWEPVTDSGSMAGWWPAQEKCPLISAE